jgi:two-component system NtrC family sensor kinase
LHFEKEAERLAIKTTFRKYLGQVYSLMGGVYRQKKDPLLEKKYYHLGIQVAKEQNNLISLSGIYHLLTRRFIDDGEKDSAIYYARQNLETIRKIGPVSGLSVNLGTVYEHVYLAYKLGNERDSLIKYQGLTLAVKDSLYQVRIRNLTDFQHVTLQEQLRLQDVEKERERYQASIRMYAMLVGLAILFIIGLLLYRNNRQNRRAKVKIEKAYDDLKATQQQLIQSEKMASLGELTAGIAHEIQNPLNFVNNFSEVNKELLAEMKEEIAKGNYDEVKIIADDIISNEDKINHHGKRADGIVKGMLQHSRNSSGQKELTDINDLADEYLRLAYHGMRAKDNTFNVSLKTDFDQDIGKISIVPQDTGRVILNILTNAFHAVSERKNLGEKNYEPRVSVSTKKTGANIHLTVKDNGTGIPEKILDKIFQPFFTTKPTGKGTGLGLSLSYDIVKSQGGEIKVITKENEGTRFIIILPLTTK